MSLSIVRNCQFPFDSLDKALKSHFRTDLIASFYQEMVEFKKEIQIQYETADHRSQVIYAITT